jgi:hypothetical protein
MHFTDTSRAPVFVRPDGVCGILNADTGPQMMFYRAVVR